MELPYKLSGIEIRPWGVVPGSSPGKARIIWN